MDTPEHEALLARLVENDAIIEAATDGPWAWSEEGDGDWTLDDQGPNLETVKRTEPHPFDGSTGAEETVISAWGHDAWGIFVEEHDKEFIATARTEWPKVNAAVRAALELVNQTLEDIAEYREQHVSSEGDDIREDYAKLIREVIEEEMRDG